MRDKIKSTSGHKKGPASSVFDLGHNGRCKQEELQHTLKELADIKYAVDQSSIVAITDNKGVITYANKKFTEISQYSQEELLGQTHRIINSKYHSKEFMKNLWDTINAGKVWHGEIRNRAKDGHYYWVDTTITPVKNERGKITDFISIRNDITKRKELEIKKDEFLGITSHELKTPITTIKAFTQLMQKQACQLQDKRFVEYLNKMDLQVNRLTKLVHDLLDVSKIQSGKLQYERVKFNLRDLTKEIIDDIQVTTDRHKIIFEDHQPLPVMADPYRIGQVLVNLLSNAIKYSPQSDKIIVKLTKDNSYSVVSVQDFGIGISRENQKKIFERFYRVDDQERNSYPGLGLGLYIAGEIVKRFGGKIWVKSRKGQGAIFSFSLPYRGFNPSSPA